MGETATLRCQDKAVVLEYLGNRRWKVQSASGAEWTGPHEQLPSVIRQALGLTGDIPYNSAIVEVETSTGVRGAIKNNTFPTRSWFYDLGDGGVAGVEDGIEPAILAAIEGLRLHAASSASNPVPPLSREELGREALLRTSDLSAWAERLSQALAQRLQLSTHPEREANTLIGELRALGHDLWSVDESDDFAIWSHDYTRPTSGRRLTLHFSFAAYETPMVEVTAEEGE